MFIGDLLLSTTTPDVYNPIGSIIEFILAYLPYKLWYRYKKDNQYTPKVDSVDNLIKIFIIIFITTLVYALLHGIYTDIKTNGILMIDPWTLGFSGFALIFCIIGLILKDLLRINPYKPKIRKNKFNPILSYLSIAIGIITTIITTIYLKIYNLTSFEPYFETIIIISLLVYLIIPFNDEIRDNLKGENKINLDQHRINLSLIEKLLLMYQILTIIISIVLVIAAYNNIITYPNFNLDNILILANFNLNNILILPNFDIYYRIFLTMNLTLIIMFLIFLKYIENYITKPLEDISSYSKEYVYNRLKNSSKIIEHINKYSDENKEVKNLAYSYSTMIKDIENYIKNLKTLTSEKEKNKAELKIAHKIQKSFIPTNFSLVKDKNIDME